MSFRKDQECVRGLGESFIAQIAERNRIHLLPFKRPLWFAAAYSTMQRTLRGEFTPLLPEQKNRLEERLFSQLLDGRRLSLDSIGREIGEISSEYGISVGHAQKVVGMLSKYAYATAHVAPHELPANLLQFVEWNIDDLPVPIDNFVLEALFQKYRENFGDIVKRGATYKVLSGDDEVPWSRLPSLSVWQSLQRRIQSLAVAQSQTPMEYEMRNLWVVKTTAPS